MKPGEKLRAERKAQREAERRAEERRMNERQREQRLAEAWRQFGWQALPDRFIRECEPHRRDEIEFVPNDAYWHWFAAQFIALVDVIVKDGWRPTIDALPDCDEYERQTALDILRAACRRDLDAVADLLADIPPEDRRDVLVKLRSTIPGSLFKELVPPDDPLPKATVQSVGAQQLEDALPPTSPRPRIDLWIAWYCEYLKDGRRNEFGRIRDRWNDMPLEQRKLYSPHDKIGKAKQGYDTVRKAIERAGAIVRKTEKT